MKSTFLFITFLGWLSISVQAQIIGPIESPYNSVRQNSVSSITAFGDTVWISPSLNRNIGNSAEWYTPENADSLYEGRGRVFSIALGQNTIVSGLGYSAEIPDGSVPAGLGFYFSTDGGYEWRFSDFPLDADPPDKCDSSSPNYTAPANPDDYDPDCDIIFEYGGQTYVRTRITVPQQSPPYNVDFKGNVVFAAAWASGLLRSTDFGNTWEKVILPPSGYDSLVPDKTYAWPSKFTIYPNGDSETVLINRFDPRGDNNLLGFSVFIDSRDRVWFGSANGVNISENALTAPVDSISWQNINFDNSPDGLTSDWIIEINEDPETGKIWMTNWVAETQGSLFYQKDRFSLVSTNDGGKTFEQHLIGERINDVSFKDGHVFAAGDNGLFISPDGGQTWIEEYQIKSPNTFIKKNAQYYSAAATTNRVWIGTSDGIASTGDLGQTWEITRVNFPLKGGNIHDPDAPDVDAFAYPNPYSPDVHDLLRIKFEVRESGNVRVRLFDYGMNLVREVENKSFSPGTYEAVWDGYDEKGRKVANGPYIYVIETAGGKVNGKFLLVE